MIKRRIDVDFVVNLAGFSPMLKEVPVGVNFIDLGCTRFSSRLPSLVRYLRRNRPECVLSAGHFSNEIAILGKVFSTIKVRVVVSEHTSLYTELSSLPVASARRVAIPPICRFLYPFADGIVAVSNGVRGDSEKLFRLKAGACRTIYNPVDVGKILQLGEQPVDHPWFLSDGPPVVLGIGRLERQKDFINLLEAFAEVRKHVTARLVILGEGSQRTTLIAKVDELGLGDCVWLAGFVSNPYPYLKRASVFSLSSEWEGLPVALIEALAFGIPIVSTDCPSGPSEILASGKYGIMVPIKDSKALAQGIIKVLKGYRSNMPEDALAKYSVDAVLDQYLEVLSEPAPEIWTG
jgi:glycosyltransferase involved in cell wall biosynthesis